MAKNESTDNKTDNPGLNNKLVMRTRSIEFKAASSSGSLEQ